MRAHRIVPHLLLALFSFVASEAHAQTDSTDVHHYALSSDSRYETGCFGPCACPVLFSNGLEGTFDLKHVGFDGLYEDYEVSNVRWTVPDTTTNLTIQGSGIY